MISLRTLRPLILLSASKLLISCSQQEPPHPAEILMNDPESTLEPPPEVTPKVFKKWRDARRGKKQAQKLNNAYWQWILESESEISAYAANQHFAGPSSFGGNPCWEASRFGQTKTTLPDGRQILIAGEHEDYYDPDFFIYNDVIIRHPEGKIDFLGYPEKVFPPTDFHTATQLDDQIILIGNLGYPDDRKPEKTQILILDTTTWKITKQASSGENPGWIHRHQATLAEDKKSILITTGVVYPADPELPLMENIDDWRLHLQDWRWERLTKRNWPLFEITRTDGERNQLWEMRQFEWQEKFGKRDIPKFYQDLGQDIDPEILKELEEQADYPAPKDTQALAKLYQPNEVPHKQIPERELEDEDDLSEYGVTRIEVQGITIRYKEESHSLQLTIEGELPEATTKALVDDLIQKLEKVEGEKFESKKLR